MTTQHSNPPAPPGNTAAASARQLASADAACGLPMCGLPIAEHPPVQRVGVPEGPMQVDGVVVGNAHCAYLLALGLAGHLCESCGQDNRRCGHTHAAHAWTTRLRRSIVLPAVRP